MSLTLMKVRVNNTGASPRNEKINNGRRILEYDFKHDPQYNENVVFYGTENQLKIKMYDEKYTNSYGVTMKFQTLYNEHINFGDIIYDFKLNEYWLCLESALVGEIHNEGKVAKCNRILKWQELGGNIYALPIVNRNASQYNNGETGNNIITLASDQLFIYTQLNEHTVVLDRGIKFFIDENTVKPTVYELTRPDTVDYSYMGAGMMGMIVTECSYNPSENDLRYGVCNYISPTVPPVPDLSPDKSIILSIDGGTDLKIGRSETYTVTAKDLDGNKITNCDFNWNIVSDFANDIIRVVNGNTITLKVENEDYVDSLFLLQSTTKDNAIVKLEISIIGIYS